MESILNLLGHPEQFHWMMILVFWFVIFCFVHVVMTGILVVWKSEKIGTGTALYIGLAYSGLIFILLTLIDIGWILYHWTRSMSWTVLLPHFVAIVVVLLWTWLFPYRLVRDDLNNVSSRLSNYENTRIKYGEG